MKPSSASVSCLIMLFVSFTQGTTGFAGDPVYFKTADGERFWCDQDNLTYNLDHENGKLAAICSLLAQPGVEDGMSEETAIKLDVNGKLFKKYVLDLFRYGKVAFKNKSDAENTLTLCQDLGLPRAEKYICTEVLKIKPRQARAGLLDMNLAQGSGGSANKSKMDEDLGNFVEIQGGTFQMGSPVGERHRRMDETQHPVTLSDFELSEAPVTQETYAKIMGTNPSFFKAQEYCPGSFKIVEGPGGQQNAACADHPVENVSWNDAIQFINAVNTKFQDTGYQFGLPTEAQLEYAFRAGMETAFVSGEDETELGEYIWYSTNSGNQTHPVKSKRANEFGIYRSCVWVWANDRYYGDYLVREAIDPQGSAIGWERILRGGAWNLGAAVYRSAFRGSTNQNTQGAFGFYLLRTPPSFR